MDILVVLKANIKHKKGAFKSIITLTALIVFAFIVTVSNSDNIDFGVANSYEYAQTPTFTAFANKNKMPEDISEQISKHEKVTSVKITECIGADNITIDGREISQLTLFYKASNPIYRVLSGDLNGYIENPEPLKSGEIDVPYPLTSTYSVKIGSKISFGKDKNKQEFVVKGFIEEPFLGAAPIGTKRVFISDYDFDRICDGIKPDSLGKILDIGINITEDADFVTVKRELNEMCGLVDNSIISLSKAETEGYTKIYSDIATKILYIFVLLLTVIVIISICHSISVSIEMEYVNLGILKAQGVTSGKIRLIYILQYLIAEIIGVIIGFVISIPALYGMNYIFIGITGILTFPEISVIKGILMAISLIVITMLFVILTTRKATKISPVRAISGGKNEVYFDSRLNLPIKARPLSLFLSIRQFTSRIKSYCGSIFIVALLIYFMMTVTVLAQKISDEFNVGTINQNITVYMTDDFDVNKTADIEQAVLDIDSEAKAVFVFGNYIMADGIEIQCSAYSRPEVMYKAISGRLPIYDNEVAVTEISAEMFGKGIGDTISLGGENAKDFIITGTYQSFNDVGKTILITTAGRYRIDKTIPGFLVELSDISLLKTVENALNDKFGDYIKVTEIKENANAGSGMDDFLKTVCNILVLIIYAVSIAFAAVVVGMICSKTFIKERPDIGIFKALGFTSKNLRVQFSLRFMIISLIGSMLGGIASCFLTTPLLVAILRMVGLTQLENGVSLTTFAIPASLLVFSFTLFSFVTMRKIKRVEVRELVE